MKSFQNKVKVFLFFFQYIALIKPYIQKAFL